MNAILKELIKIKLLKMKRIHGNHINPIVRNQNKRLILFNKYFQFKEYRNIKNGKI